MIQRVNSFQYVLPEYYGWLRPYPFFLFAGFLVSLLAIFIKTKNRNIPFLPIEKFIFIAIPFGLIFASFFGKLDIKHPLPFYELFCFWNPGLSIHGSIIGGLIAGMIFFPSQSKKYQISMWVWIDLIAPNILLGQIIGRWGNFFNHEILGHQVTYDSLKWLPEWIRNSCFRFNINSKNLTPELINPNNGININNIVFRQPLFLYEIIGLILLYLTITFFVPNIGKIFSIKPWKIKSFQNEFINLTWKGKWNKAYYELVPDKELAKKYENNFSYIKINPKLTKYQQYKMVIKNKKLYFLFLLKKDVKNLTKLHNKYNIKIIRCGVQGSIFFVGYNFIRIFIETQRQNQELFIKNLPTVSYSVIILFMFLGIISFIFAQFISPYKWRKNNWYYEKQF